MRLLLDTHVLLWWLGDNPRLGPEARGRFQRGDDELYASIASLWEIATKNRTGKIDATASLIAAHLEIGKEQAETPVTNANRYARILLEKKLPTVVEFNHNSSQVISQYRLLHNRR